MLRFVVLASFLAIAYGSTIGRHPVSRLGQAPIVGGDPGSITDVPWQVALMYDSNGVGFKLLHCSGSIVKSNVILTAAHCFTDYTAIGRWSIRAGSTYYASGGTVYTPSKLVIHPNFSTSTRDNNVALLFTTTNIAIDGITTQLAVLPAAGTPVIAGVSALVAGWGTTTDLGSFSAMLLKIYIPVIDQNTCANIYAGVYDVNERMFCAGDLENGGKDACQGDGGGPLVIDGYVVGITSWANGCAEPQNPRVWIKVSSFISWINANST